MIAIRPGGTGEVTGTHVAWSTPRGSPFVPSAIAVDGLLYLINDMQSILTVYDAQTGALAYQGRLGIAQREGFSASPVAVNGELFFTNDDGETFVSRRGNSLRWCTRTPSPNARWRRPRSSTVCGTGERRAR